MAVRGLSYRQSSIDVVWTAAAATSGTRLVCVDGCGGAEAAGETVLLCAQGVGGVGPVVKLSQGIVATFDASTTVVIAPCVQGASPQPPQK